MPRKKKQITKTRKRKRAIDKKTKQVYSGWGKSFTLISKYKVQTWKGVLIIAFFGGFFAALIWSVANRWHSSSDAASVYFPNESKIERITDVSGFSCLGVNNLKITKKAAIFTTLKNSGEMELNIYKIKKEEKTTNSESFVVDELEFSNSLKKGTFWGISSSPKGDFFAWAQYNNGEKFVTAYNVLEGKRKGWDTNYFIEQLAINKDGLLGVVQSVEMGASHDNKILWVYDYKNSDAAPQKISILDDGNEKLATNKTANQEAIQMNDKWLIVEWEKDSQGEDVDLIDYYPIEDGVVKSKKGIIEPAYYNSGNPASLNYAVLDEDYVYFTMNRSIYRVDLRDGTGILFKEINSNFPLNRIAVTDNLIAVAAGGDVYSSYHQDTQIYFIEKSSKEIIKEVTDLLPSANLVSNHTNMLGLHLCEEDVPSLYSYLVEGRIGESPIDGVCGTAHAIETTEKPPMAGFTLCGLAETASDPVETETSWTWTCDGLNGGATANCSAPKSGLTPVVNVACGPAHERETYAVSFNKEEACAKGVMKELDQQGGKLVWKCSTEDDSESVDCSAPLKTEACNDLATVCGPAHGSFVVGSNPTVALCKEGAVDQDLIKQNDNTWHWKCYEGAECSECQTISSSPWPPYENIREN